MRAQRPGTTAAVAVDGMGVRPARCPGFTLIEICIALLVALALFSLAAGIVRYGLKERDLPGLRDATATLVQTARTRAMQTGKPQEILLEATRISLRHSAAQPQPERTVLIPADVRFEIQLWPSDRWRIPERPVFWLFQPSGLCEPYSLRFSQGESWISFRIHPLTGAIDQESRTLQQ